ncbi:Outer membrane porin F [Desulfosarcina cetonica]|nr:Outer membrane porin F [Desulfosarcina cetonica]
MRNRCVNLIVAFMVVGMLGACATYQPVPAFTPVDINADGYVQKTQNAVFIIDSSSSMAEGYQQWKKFDLGKALMENMAKTIPADMQVNTALRSFGHDLSVSRESTMLVDDMGPFNRADFDNGLAQLTKPGGISLLGKAITAAGNDLDGLSGKSAIIIVSDGKDMGSAPVAAATALKEKMGDALCIYTVAVDDNEAGMKLLEEVANVGGCGFATQGDSLMDGAAMGDFISKVFLGDAIVPESEPAPAPPPTTILDQSKDVWSFENIHFAFDSAVLTPDSFAILDQIVDALNTYPNLNVLVEGHTDSIGTNAYNLKLSKRRAQAVVDYLVSKGISPSRLSSEGFGEERPIASNKTAEGRAHNRRVQFDRVE